MMKKKMLCLLLCVLLVVMTVSCNDEPKETNEPKGNSPESAQELYDRIDGQMNALKSYKTDMSISMTSFVEGYEMKMDATSSLIMNVNVDGKYYFYEESTAKITIDELSVEETLKTIEAYYAGNYFISNEESGMIQKLYSPMTAEEAKEYRRRGQRPGPGAVLTPLAKEILEEST